MSVYARDEEKDVKTIKGQDKNSAKWFAKEIGWFAWRFPKERFKLPSSFGRVIFRKKVPLSQHQRTGGLVIGKIIEVTGCRHAFYVKKWLWHTSIFCFCLSSFFLLLLIQNSYFQLKSLGWPVQPRKLWCHIYPHNTAAHWFNRSTSFWNTVPFTFSIKT